MDGSSEQIDDERDLITIVPEDKYESFDNSDTISIESFDLRKVKIEDEDDLVITGMSAYGRKTVSLPVTFFNIPRNVRLLSECKPFSLDIVDCDKYPDYYKFKRTEDEEHREIKVEVNISRDDDEICSEAETIDLNIEGHGVIEESLLGLQIKSRDEKNLFNEHIAHCKMNHSEVISPDQQVDSINTSIQDNNLTGLNNSLNNFDKFPKHSTDSQKNASKIHSFSKSSPNKCFSFGNENKSVLKLGNIDPKKNKGLIGLKIKKQIIIDELDESDDDCQIIENPDIIKIKCNIIELDVLKIIENTPETKSLDVIDKTSLCKSINNEVELKEHFKVKSQDQVKDDEVKVKEILMFHTQDNATNGQLQFKSNEVSKTTEKVINKKLSVGTPNIITNAKVIIKEDVMIEKSETFENEQAQLKKNPILEITEDVKNQKAKINGNVQVVTPNKVTNVLLENSKKVKNYQVQLKKNKLEKTEYDKKKKARKSENIIEVTHNKVTNDKITVKENWLLGTHDKMKKDQVQIIENKLLKPNEKVKVNETSLTIKLNKVNEDKEIIKKNVLLEKYNKVENNKVQIENKLIETNEKVQINENALLSTAKKVNNDKITIKDNVLLDTSVAVQNDQDQIERNSVLETLLKVENKKAETNENEHIPNKIINEKITVTENVLQETPDNIKNTLNATHDEILGNLKIHLELTPNIFTKIYKTPDKMEQCNNKYIKDLQLTLDQSQKDANNIKLSNDNSDCNGTIKNKTINTKGMKLSKCVEKLNNKCKEIATIKQDIQLQGSADPLKEQNGAKVDTKSLRVPKGLTIEMVDINSAQENAASSCDVIKDSVSITPIQTSTEANLNVANQSRLKVQTVAEINNSMSQVLQENTGQTEENLKPTQTVVQQAQHSEFTHKNNVIFHQNTLAFKRFKLSSLFNNAVSPRTRTNTVRPYLYKPHYVSMDPTKMYTLQSKTGSEHNFLPVVCVTSQPDNNFHSGKPFARFDTNKYPTKRPHESGTADNVKKVRLLPYAQHSGYSPPILPIPSVRTSLEMLKRDARVEKYYLKSEVVRPENKVKPTKKISLAEYKNRFNINVSEPG